MKELNVKVGDKVVYEGGGYASRKEITEVIRITPTGIIRVATNPDIQFDKCGRQKGGDCWHRASLLELTPELEKKIKERDVIAHCKRKFNSTVIDYEMAVKLLEVLEGGKE